MIGAEATASSSSPEEATSSVAAMNFQGLSLLSPGRGGAHLINHGASNGNMLSHTYSYSRSPEYGGGGDGGMSLDGSAAAGAASPASSLPGSQASHARSCFSKYRHHHQEPFAVYAPSRPTGGDAAANNKSSSINPNLLSPFSTATNQSVSGGSPRIAPLIVLGPKSWLASSASSVGAASFSSSAGAMAPALAPVLSNVAAQLESAAALMDAPPSEPAGSHNKASPRHGRSPQHRVGAFSASSTPDDRSNHKKRPPRHQHQHQHQHQHHATSPHGTAVAAPQAAAPPSVNRMQSLDGSFVPSPGFAPDGPSTPPRFLPPSTVLCHPTTPGSTLSVDVHPSRSVVGVQPFPVLTFKTASKSGPNGNYDHDDEELMAHPEDGRAAGSQMASPGRGGSSRVRQRQADESPGKRSVMSMSPTSTPLPRLTLTPRSTTSSHAARQLFLSLPTPGDLGGNGGAENEAAASRASTARAPHSAALPSPKRNSYIPLPEWASSGCSGASKEACVGSSFFFETETHNQGSCGSKQPPTSPPTLLSKSLLSPPSPNDAIERFLKDSSYSMGTNHNGSTAECMDEGVGHHGNDDDSLSASDDDDEAFFLATPLAIQEEKQSTLQQSKHRKLRDQSYTSLRSHQSLASSNIMQASSTSLRGMNFVTSSTSLDKIGSKLSSGALCLGPVSSLKRQDSQTSIGLTLEGTNAPSNEESATKGAMTCGRSSSSFSNSAMGAARDLVTPPVMAQPKSPPPLPSPRIDTTTSAATTLPRSLPNQRSHGCEAAMDLGGSNWSSPSPPPSSSAHRSWPCSGEADSPIDRYTTRVWYTSTAPDRPPSD
jgi:hypothetical protein